MDIDSKKELAQENDKRIGLTINREELLKQLMDDAKVIDAEVAES
jgi:hypothetical protein